MVALLLPAIAGAQHIDAARAGIERPATVSGTATQTAPPLPGTVQRRFLSAITVGLIGYIVGEEIDDTGIAARAVGIVAGSALGGGLPRGERGCLVGRRLRRAAFGAAIGSPLAYWALDADNLTSREQEQVFLSVVALAAPAILATIAVERAC